MARVRVRVRVRIKVEVRASIYHCTGLRGIGKPRAVLRQRKHDVFLVNVVDCNFG